MACLREQRDYETYKPLADRARSGGLLGQIVAAREAGDSVKADSLDLLYSTNLHSLGADTLAERWQSSRATCELAKRNYSRFMR